MENVIPALGNTLSDLLGIYSWVLIGYILLSWFPNARESKFGQILSFLCEPFLAPFRRIIPPIGGMLDISPIVALFVLRMAQTGIAAIFG
ncbi:YggT family protein [Exiguobacterium profundum]|jgi:YggT family protein|uniref:YggT family protein n=1 Tax=Exiguobacterium profundum TaxID=307643 RepID=A0ABY8AY17_9BACL|nr:MULTISPECIES: YggT family protein [Exiguobacterium]MCM3279290.1 YggT family protein [Exiguobacterium sp. MER 193]WED54273.1 YggT family protein [Exiguobacterium profundum]